jgi:hypothetical protein
MGESCGAGATSADSSVVSAVASADVSGVTSVCAAASSAISPFSGAGGRTSSTAARRLRVLRARRGRAFAVLRSLCSPAGSVAAGGAGTVSAGGSACASLGAFVCDPASVGAAVFSASVRRRFGARRLRAGGLVVGFDAPFAGAPGAVWAPSSVVVMFLLPLPHGECAEKRGDGRQGGDAIRGAAARCVALCWEEEMSGSAHPSDYTHLAKRLAPSWARNNHPSSPCDIVAHHTRPAIHTVAVVPARAHPFRHIRHHWRTRSPIS